MRPLEGFQRVDAEGYLVNEARRENVRPPWDEALAAAVKAYRDHLREDLLAVYLRGSVARGHAVAGVSDLDTLAVVHRVPPGWHERWGRRVEENLGERFRSFCTGVDLRVVPREPLPRWARFHVKTQAVCVFGEDLAADLPPVRPGPDAILFAPRILARLARARARLAAGERVHLSRLLKASLRAGFECLVLLGPRPRYTRDLYRCAETLWERFPAEEPFLRRALACALDPARRGGDDPSKLLAGCEDLLARLLAGHNPGS